jgi:hypothetical protein
LGQTGSTLGYPDVEASHIDPLKFSDRVAAKPQRRGKIPLVDPIALVIIVVVVTPVAVLLALAKSARLRGPLERPESRKPVGTLVTEAIPEEQPGEDDEPDPELRGPQAGL